MYTYIPKLETVRSGAGKMKVILKKYPSSETFIFLLLDIQMHPFSRRVRPCFSSFLFLHPPNLLSDPPPTLPSTLSSAA